MSNAPVDELMASPKEMFCYTKEAEFISFNQRSKKIEQLLRKKPR